MKLNIFAVNPNRLLFSSSEVKTFASEPSFFSFNIIAQIQKKQVKLFLVRILISMFLNSRKEDKGFQN
jgi:hypothetical protein